MEHSAASGGGFGLGIIADNPLLILVIIFAAGGFFIYREMSRDR